MEATNFLASSLALPRVLTTLNFFDTRLEKPTAFRWTAATESERPINLLTPDAHEVQIHDMRGLSILDRHVRGLTLEKAGFEMLEGWGSEGESIANAWIQHKWDDVKWIETEYYSFVER